jgi:hypothetical protein
VERIGLVAADLRENPCHRSEFAATAGGEFIQPISKYIQKKIEVH